MLHCCLVLGFLVPAAEPQSTCSSQHADTGVFSCYPGTAQTQADAKVPEIFHLSAQANAPSGRLIGGYRVLLDNRLISEKRFFAAVARLSIETNLRSPFSSGTHTLQLVVRGAGMASLTGLHFYLPDNTDFCDPFSRSDVRSCNLLAIKTPLRWSVNQSTPPSAEDPLEGFPAYLRLYARNLESIEVDNSDAMALDTQGNLYVAAHAISDVDLRKYGPDGSLVYSSLIHSCGDGFMSITGLSIDPAGRAWIAGNANACLKTTPNAIHSQPNESGRASGFVMLVDTRQPASTAPLYVSYLSPIENRINGIRSDADGNAYIAGTTVSSEFPHASALNLAGRRASAPATLFGFVAALDPSGTGIVWSTLLENSQVNNLALDRSGDVYIAGTGSCIEPDKTKRVCDDVLVAKLTERGRRVSYLAHFRGSPGDEAQAIESENGQSVLVAGANTAFALEPCKTGIFYSHHIAEEVSDLPEIELAPALHAFAARLAGGLHANGRGSVQDRRPLVFTAPECKSSAP